MICELICFAISDAIIFCSKSSTKKSGLTGKMKEMHNARSQPQTYSGKVANRSLRDMGAFSWTPLATRTAVGYGDSLYVQDVSSVEMSKRPESAPNTKMRYCFCVKCFLFIWFVDVYIYTLDNIGQYFYSQASFEIQDARYRLGSYLAFLKPTYCSLSLY